METVTPLSSTGSGGRRDSLASVLFTSLSEGASASVERAMPSIPAASPVTAGGVGVGEAAATGRLLAPVANETGAGEAAGVGLGAGVSLVATGTRREKTSLE